MIVDIRIYNCSVPQSGTLDNDPFNEHVEDKKSSKPKSRKKSKSQEIEPPTKKVKQNTSTKTVGICYIDFWYKDLMVVVVVVVVVVVCRHPRRLQRLSQRLQRHQPQRNL
jgi:hypothetical protein